MALLSDHAAVTPTPRVIDASVDGGRPRGLFTADQAIRVLAGLLFCILLAAAWQLMASSLSSPLIPEVSDIGAELQAIVVSGEAVADIRLDLLTSSDTAPTTVSRNAFRFQERATPVPTTSSTTSMRPRTRTACIAT